MIIPCIDLMDGSVVQLVQGRAKALDAGDPLQVLERFAAFPVIQVIDLDAALGQGSNHEAIEQLVPHARIRVGGGIRDVEKAVQLAGLGVEKLIVGTAAFSDAGINDDFLRALIDAVPKERILIALDSKDGRVVVKGWRQSLQVSAEELLPQLEAFCSGFLCTYVDKEGMMEGTDLGWFKRLRAITELELTAAGGITTYDEIRALQSMNVHAALGMAVYTGRLSLETLASM